MIDEHGDYIIHIDNETHLNRYKPIIYWAMFNELPYRNDHVGYHIRDTIKRWMLIKKCSVCAIGTYTYNLLISLANRNN